MRGFRWSKRLNGTGIGEFLTDDDSIYNTIDKDILLTL